MQFRVIERKRTALEPKPELEATPHFLTDKEQKAVGVGRGCAYYGSADSYDSRCRSCKPRFIKLLPIFFFLAACTKQSQYPTLTQQQMREDFEYTMQVLYDVGTSFHTKELLTGINPFDEARRVFEENIDTVTTFEGFYGVMHRVLCCMCDQHTGLNPPHSYAMHIPDDVKKKNEALWEWAMDYIYGFSIKYIDGRYFVVDTMFFNDVPLDFGARDFRNHIVDTLPAGTEILGMNGYDMRWFESQKINDKTRWNVNDRRYVISSIFDPYYYGIQGDGILHIRRPNSSEVQYLNNAKNYAWSVGLRYQDHEVFKLDVFPNDVLYIRIPKMDNKEFEPVISKLKQMRGFKPSKVIVDVRNNGGGSDFVWHKLLAMLLPDTMRAERLMVVRRSAAVDAGLKSDSYYANFYAKETPITERPMFKHKLLPENVEFALYSDKALIIAPDSASLRYDGPVYLLLDDRCYSSTLNFLAAFGQHPQCVSVGEPTGWYGGAGLNPFCFCMPNSQLTFCVEAIADMTNVANPEDLLHDRVKVEIVPSIAERARANAYTGQRYSYEYMSQHDTVFKYVMAQ